MAIWRLVQLMHWKIISQIHIQGGRKPKPKHPSSVSKLISLFWKRGSNSRICISLHERRSAVWNSFVFQWNKTLFTFLSQIIVLVISTLKERNFFFTLNQPWGNCGGILYIYPIITQGRDLLKKSNTLTYGTGQVISSTNGSGGSAGIEGLILSPLLAVWGKSMADLEKALRRTVNGILHCWKLSPALLLPPSLHLTQTVN